MTIEFIRKSLRFPFGFSLPAEVVRRVNALRNLQVQHHQLEASFFEEVHALECRYLTQYQPLYEKVKSVILPLFPLSIDRFFFIQRLNIIKGAYEPTEAEGKCTFDGDDQVCKRFSLLSCRGKTTRFEYLDR